jgi:hypothetical protein
MLSKEIGLIMQHEMDTNWLELTESGGTYNHKRRRAAGHSCIADGRGYKVF